MKPFVLRYFHIDVDGFRKINGQYGYSVGDTILLTLSRRLSRLLKAGDSLARIAGDQFALLLMSETEPKKIAAFADAIRRTLNAPVEFADDEIVMTASHWTGELVSGTYQGRTDDAGCRACQG